MTQSTTVAAFEAAFAEYVGARYAIALCNGTATLHPALVALGVQPGDRVAVPPLTMSATTLAVLQAGAVPVFCDVDPETYLLDSGIYPPSNVTFAIPVSLYGLVDPAWDGTGVVNDAAQTLAEWSDVGNGGFASYSFQSSKILSLGEGGMLVTDSEELATRAREFSSLGYRMRPDQPRIDPAVLKSPTYARHHWPLAFNYRMNEFTAQRGLWAMGPAALPLEGARPATVAYERGLDAARELRQRCARMYRDALAGCDWLTPQRVPEGWGHDYWTYAVAVDTSERWGPLAQAIERHGGERPYAAWRLTYQEPAFGHLWQSALSEGPLPGGSLCPVAESLQPRLMQFQTNKLDSAERNAEALAKAIKEVGG